MPAISRRSEKALLALISELSDEYRGGHDCIGAIFTPEGGRVLLDGSPSTWDAEVSPFDREFCRSTTRRYESVMVKFSPVEGEYWCRYYKGSESDFVDTTSPLSDIYRAFEKLGGTR